MNEIDIDSDIMDNNTVCTTYIPGIGEYYRALGWAWGLFFVVGCTTCILLYGFFIKQTIFSIRNVHSVFRNSVIWISSVYPFMSLMTIVGFVIPRSQQVCYTVKVLYMMIGISKFSDLTLLMYGSEEVMLWALRDSEMKLNVGPACCCCWFLPRIKITKKTIRLIIAGIRQLPFTQSFYLVMIMILQAANQVVIGSLDPKGSYVWLHMFNLITSLCGVYCLNLLSKASYDYLHRYLYNQLSFVMTMLIIVTKMQSSIFNIMAYYEIFPCVPPISHSVYRQTVENYFYIVEMFVFGIYSYKIYRKVHFDTANPTVIRTDPRGNIRPHHQAYLPSLSSHVEEYGYGFPGTDFLEDVDNFDDQGFDTEILANLNRNTYDFSDTYLVINREDSPRTSGSGYQRLD